jgi:replication factor C large subunit
MNIEHPEWAEKYRPKNLQEIAGHNKIVQDLLKWAREWDKESPKDKALILYGKPGVGKTSFVHALAYQMEWDKIELNASDQRTAGIIKKVAGSASKMGTFDGISGKRLVILDEADNLHGNYDRGGARAIIQVIKQSSQPIILIANEFYNVEPALRLSCKAVQFKALNSSSIVSVLKNICIKESVVVSKDVLDVIANSANGDLRSAINDLQAMAIGKSELTIDDITTGSRDIRETIFKAMNKIFRGTDIRSAQEAAWQIDESPEDLINWIDENLPISYKKDTDLVAGYIMLSRADQFLGRVRRRQNYRLWRYASFFMTGGVAAAKTQNYSGFIKLKSPQYWRKLGQTRTKRNIRDSTASKIGVLCHVSKKNVRSDLIWFFKCMMKSKQHSIGLSVELDLNPDEIAFLLDTRTSTKKVKQIYDAAQKMIIENLEHNVEVFGGFGYNADNQQNNKIEEEVIEQVIDEQKDTEKGSQKSLFDF